MRRFLPLAVFTLLIASCGTPSKTQVGRAQTNFRAEQLPDMVAFLPGPPDFNSSDFIADSLRYEWGKSLRCSERGAQAVADANGNTEYLFAYFAPAFGIEVTPEGTPETYRLLKLAINDASLSVHGAKKYYKRPRPFEHFGEHTSLPSAEPRFRGTGSYPSGHTVRAWECALMMAELNPSRQNEILKAGYEYGQSRVICGYHYQSDVDAARLVAAAVFARQHADKDISRQIEKAKKELAKKIK